MTEEVQKCGVNNPEDQSPCTKEAGHDGLHSWQEKEEATA